MSLTKQGKHFKNLFQDFYFDTGGDEYRPGFMEMLPGGQATAEWTAPKLRVAFTLLPGFTLMAFAGFVDTLRLASDVGDRSRPELAEWTLVGKNNNPVPSSCGAEIAHQSVYSDPKEFDVIVVVGGIIRDDEFYYEPELLKFIGRAADQGKLIVGLCTGVFALAKAGVMDGRRCCVHGYHICNFQEQFPDVETVIDQIFVEDDGRLTCAGGAASVDAAGRVIEHHFGEIRARKCMPHLLVDKLRDAKHPQLSYVDNFFAVHDERVRMAVFLMQLNIASPLSIEDIARANGTKVRGLERAFHRELGMTPSSFYRKMRLERARWYLGHTDWTITMIAFETGFADTSHLTRSFKREFGILPSDCRTRRA
ncbi:GlxA family transcriptional regulator [Mameliella alba]|uniref:GlxA family transcriptional regulator n=1 Tax=Mameliella alba TaxID=561184 RepID=UPI001C94E289|nr:GlxA family transcriptional regulator [Mameliella alba]MBY6120402.1 GlxA family transcriptional regulator [Mameliella alba]